jgi:SAM-dependent methyltransferase
MQWFAQRGHLVTGIDRAPEAIESARRFGEAVLADIEKNPWPLMNGDKARQFEAVIVTNYLWRPLFPIICDSVAPGGVLIYETFSKGNETLGKPSCSDFLLRPAELLAAFTSMHIIGFEDGFLECPDRFVQRIVAVQSDLRSTAKQTPKFYML